MQHAKNQVHTRVKCFTWYQVCLVSKVGKTVLIFRQQPPDFMPLPSH